MEIKNRPRVLLCWGYYRKGWIEVFEKLNPHFEFHYLFWLGKEMERESYTDCQKHYWEDFTSGQDVLKKLRPAKVVFMGVNNLVSIGLQFACTRKKIPTYVMQHGLFHDLRTNVYLDEQMAKNRIEAKEYTTTKKIYKWRFLQLFFILRSMGLRHVAWFPKLFRWQLDERRMLHLLALAKHRYPFRQADNYIVYTRFNGLFFKEIDGIGEDKMIPVGVPEFDKFFSNPDIQHARNRASGYNLLIDSALTYNEVFKTHGIITQESYNDFISKINEASQKEGKKLVIKLHPFSYQNEKFVQHPNINYLKDEDVVELVLGADHIFGFDSTLMLIAMYLKPTILFTIHDFGYLQTNVKAINVAPVLQYDDFSMDELRDAMAFRASEQAISQLVERFLYATDGRSFERIRIALEN
jgi:CDP-glycerol glycerophosphotransferase (TagB/SpsB family)